MMQRMNRRERIFVAIGFLVMLVLFCYFALISPYLGALQRLDQTIDSRHAQLLEMQQLRLDYQVLSRSFSQLEARLEQADNFAALGFIEELVGQIAGREKLAYLRPQATEIEGELLLEPVEVKVEMLDLEQVLLLLWEIDRAPAPLQVKAVRLKQRFDNSAMLDLTMTVTAVRRNR